MTKDKSTALKGVSLEHRHFAFIAHTISELEPDIRFRVAKHFERACYFTNGKFDSARFMKACGFN